MIEPTHIFRMKLIKLIFYGLAIWIWLNLARHQLFDPFNLSEETCKVASQNQTIEAVRGTIYDRNGQILAQPLTCFDFYVDLSVVQFPESLAQKLSPVLGVDSLELMKKFQGKRTMTLVKGVFDKSLYTQLIGLRLPGVYPKPTKGRFYPRGNVGAQLVGFIRPYNQDKGGLEKSYDKYLAGENGSELMLQDSYGNPIVNPHPQKKEAKDGYDLILTIDSRLQKHAQEILDGGVWQFSAKGGAIVVMNPRTGEIYAMASSPTLNPNNIDKKYAESMVQNRCVSWEFEPGSTAKVFAAAAALENKTITLDSIVYCESGRWQFAKNRVLNEAENHAFNWLTVKEALIYSSNIGMAKIGQGLGSQLFFKAGRDFGFGLNSDLSLPNEFEGRFPPAEQWDDEALIYGSIGQGFSVTPIILARALCAIANDGVMMKPYLVSAIVDNDGRVVKKNEPSVLREVVSKSVAFQLTEILTKAVEIGTGKQARVPGMKIAGKTGTAQKATPGKGYLPGKYIASFMGYFPADDPQIAIVVAIDEPLGAYYAADVAAPLFQRMAEQIIATPNDAVTGSMVQKVTASDLTMASPKPRTYSGSKMPDLVGLSIRDALRHLNSLDLKFSLDGSGWVVKQTPKAGSPLTSSTRVKLEGSIGG